MRHNNNTAVFCFLVNGHFLLGPLLTLKKEEGVCFALLVALEPLLEKKFRVFWGGRKTKLQNSPSLNRLFHFAQHTETRVQKSQRGERERGGEEGKKGEGEKE